MKIDIRYTFDGLDSTLKNDVERRLILAFSKVEAHISAIVLTLSKDDGSSNKHCSLTISLNCISDILIEETQKDLNNAINRVIQRATRIIYRKIDQE